MKKIAILLSLIVNISAQSYYVLSFDGSNDYVQIGTEGYYNSGSSSDVGSLLGDGSFSVSLWYKSSTNPGDYDFLIDQRIHSNYGDGFYILNDGRYSNKIYAAIATRASSETTFMSTTEISTGIWYHIILTWDGSNGKIYINGILETTRAISSRRSNSVGLVIGSRFTSDERYLTGSVDELGIWNVALTDDEVAALYNFGAGGGLGATINLGNYISSSNLQGYWRFNEGTGTVVADASSNSNTATIYGATWYEDKLSIIAEGIPTQFALHENYPNPFNPSTTLRFDLPEVSDITLTIYNMLGQKVKTFNMQSTPAGYHSVTWNATNDYGEQVGAGVYLYQLRANQFVKTRKMVLLK